MSHPYEHVDTDDKQVKKKILTPMFPEALWIPSVMRLQALLQQALAWPLQRPTSKQKGFVSSFLYLVSID
jgi:hypothetical protein